MRDRDVRASLREEVVRLHQGQPGGTIVIEELGLQGGVARIDLAAVNGLLHGYEIKSDKDTLDRLPAQRDVYSSIMDRVTLIIGARHAEKLGNLIPDWWGILVASQEAGQNVALLEVKPPKPNPQLDALAVASLLWKDEALQLLEDLGAAKGIRSKPKRSIYERLVASISIDELRDHVRDRLKNREGWRSDALRM